MALSSKKSQKLWLWKAVSHSSGKLLSFYCGDRSSKSLKEFIDIIDPKRKKRYYTDHFRAYNDVIDSKRLKQSKAYTYRVEQDNARQRHWLARFRRKSIVVTKSISMLSHSLNLFAYYRSQNNFNTLLQLLR